MTALGSHGLDVGSGGLRDPQPVEGQQGDRRIAITSRDGEAKSTGMTRIGTDAPAARVRLRLRACPRLP